MGWKTSLYILGYSSPPQPSYEPQPPKLKASPRLNNWSRARAIRSGRKLDRPTRIAALQTELEAEVAGSPPSSIQSEDVILDSGSEHDGDVTEGKAIYMVSDSTGWTTEHAFSAALGQFEHCLVDRGCPINTHLFSGFHDLREIQFHPSISECTLTGGAALTLGSKLR